MSKVHQEKVSEAVKDLKESHDVEVATLKAKLQKQAKDLKNKHELEMGGLKKEHSKIMEDFWSSALRDVGKLVLEARIKMAKEAKTENFGISSWDVGLWEDRLAILRGNEQVDDKTDHETTKDVSMETGDETMKAGNGNTSGQ